MGYCAKCGNTRVTLSGEPCECASNLETFFDTVKCLDVPEQYQGIMFNKSLVPADLNISYANYLSTLHDSIISMKLKYKNIVICSPANHSKSILAYSAIQALFRKGICTAPLLDVLEIRRAISEMDFGKKASLANTNTSDIFNAPYLFVKIPPILQYETYETIYMIVDRRVRKGNSTIFLYNGSWEQLVYNDNKELLKSMLGDGSFCSIENKTWRREKNE